MTFEITTEIDENKFIEESEEVSHDDENFSKEISDAINDAALKVSEEFTETQQLELEDNINSVLNSSEDSIEIKDFLQEITEKPTYTDEQRELIKSISDILSRAGDKADPLIRNDPLLKKAVINAALSMLGVGTFSENFKIAGKVVLGGAAAYFVIKTIMNYQGSMSHSPLFKLNSAIDYVELFGEFSSYAKKIHEAFMSFNKNNYFSNISKLSSESGPLNSNKVFLLDHAWLLGSSIYLFPLDKPYYIDKFDYYSRIYALSNTLENGIVAFYEKLQCDNDIPLSIRLDIGRAAILIKLME